MLRNSIILAFLAEQSQGILIIDVDIAQGSYVQNPQETEFEIAQNNQIDDKKITKKQYKLGDIKKHPDGSIQGRAQVSSTSKVPSGQTYGPFNMFKRYSFKTTWGSVCSNKFTDKSASVFCKSLNKSYKFSSFSLSSEYSAEIKSKWGPDNIKDDFPIYAS